MMNQFRTALEHGGDSLVAAMGYVENHLMQSPEDLRIRAYKGALLALHGCYAEADEGYLSVGVSMVCKSLEAAEETALSLPEIRYLAGVTLALVPKEIRAGRSMTPVQALDALLAMPRMIELDPSMQIDALVCRHLLGGAETAHLERARAINPKIAKDVLHLRSQSPVSVIA